MTYGYSLILDAQTKESYYQAVMARARPPLLLLEDDDILRRLLRDQLAPYFEVREAATCAHARVVMEAHPCALGVLDYQLPDGDGLTLLPELRARRPDFRAVLFSGGSPPFPAGGKLPTGLVASLKKPTDTVRLVAVLRQIAGLPPA